MAEGVLLVCLGKATKIADMLTSKEKEYEAVMLLGTTTDTEDITGTILSEKEVNVTNELVIEVLNSFVKEYEQVPPLYSAIKVNGRKLYEYARAGIDIKPEPRKVTIYSIKDIVIDIPKVKFTVTCSKGTYIRSLCRDIGNEIGCGATLFSLLRSEVNGYNLDTALTLDEIDSLNQKGELEQYILPTDSLLEQYLKANIKSEHEKIIMNGNKILKEHLKEEINSPDGDIIRIYFEGEFIALYKYYESENIYKPYKMFL